MLLQMAILVIAHVYDPEYEECKINDQLGEVSFKSLAQRCLGTEAMTESSFSRKDSTL